MAASSGNLVLSILEGGGSADKLQELNSSDDWIDFVPQPPFTPSTLADYAVYAIDRNFIIVHERGGDFLHFDGADWNRFSQASAVQVLDIHIISPTLAHAVDVSGDLFQWLGVSWALLGSAGASLTGVWASAANNVYAVGGSGGSEKVMLWDGATLTNVYSSLPSGSGIPTDVWGFGPNDISIVTNIANSSSRFLQWSGTSWSTKKDLPGSKIMSKIWGTAANSLWIATGIFTTAEVHFWNGSILVSQQISAVVPAQNPTGLHGLSASEVYWTNQTAGAGDTWKFDGAWTEINSLLRVDTRAVWVGPVLVPLVITVLPTSGEVGGIENMSARVARLTFDVSMAVNPALTSASSYSVSLISGVAGLRVERVIGVPSDASSVNFVDLFFSRSPEGSEFRLLTSGLFDTAGVAHDVQTDFVIKKTKVDSILSGMPNMYSSSVDSTLGQLLTAIGFQDEKIGGR